MSVLSWIRRAAQASRLRPQFKLSTQAGSQRHRAELFAEFHLERLEDRRVLAAPVLNNSGAPVLTAINEGDVSPAGDRVDAILATAGDPITDPDAGDPEGIAVIDVDDIDGVWEYSLDNGTNWTPFGAVSNTSAVLLAPDARIRFSQSTDNGSRDIRFRAWDQSTGANGDTGVNVSSNGGTTAFSNNSETAEITVNNVAPQLNNVAVLPPAGNEGDSFTLSGGITDPGIDDTFTLTVDWGDGSSDTYNYAAGTTSFSETHTYADDPAGSPDDYSIDLTLEDDDNGTGTASVDVTVNNVAPTLGSVLATPAVIDEGSGITLSGTISDPGTADTFSLTVLWGDGTSNTYNYLAGTTSFSETHVYADDPAGNPNTFSINMTLTDDDGGIDSDLTAVTVNNVAPMLGGVTVMPANNDEGDTVTLSGTITDPGTADTFSLTVLWGDGTSDTYNYVAGTAAFSETHGYRDDPAGNPNTYSVSLNLIDDDGDSDSELAGVTVTNVAPALGNVNATPATNDEGDTVTLAGTITDPGLDDTFTLMVQWGDGTSDIYSYAAGTTAFSETHVYRDDPAGNPNTYTISLTLTDDDGGSDTDTDSVTVNNVAPVLSNVIVAPGVISEGQTVTVTGGISDVGVDDAFTLVIQWGDGTSDTFNYAAGTTSFAESHFYSDDDPTGTSSDVTPIILTLTDDDNGSDVVNTSVTINNVAPLLNNLFVLPGAIVEGQTVTLAGGISEASIDDTFTLQIDWGDGNVQTVSLAAGTTSFSVMHTYQDDPPSGTPADFVPIGVTLTDDDLGTAVASTTVLVFNVDPTLNATVAPAAINEGNAVTLDLTIGDPSPLDTFNLVVNWGDGNVQLVALPAGTTSFSLNHTYADDPIGTPDVYAISITLTDDDLGVATFNTLSVTVDNSPPTLANVSATTISEGDSTTLSGTIIDSGLLDTYVLQVDWGDGTSETFNLPAGTTTFAFMHAYPDDDPTGTPVDDYAIHLTLTDDDGGMARANTTATVFNISPVITGVSATTISEGQSTTLTGNLFDPGVRDTFILLVDWADGTTSSVPLPAGTTSFSLTHLYTDDNPTGTPSDTTILQVTVVDDDTGRSVSDNVVTVTVNNLPPVLSNVVVAPADVMEGNSVTLSGGISDAGADSYLMTVTWGDGATQTLAFGRGAHAFNLTHRYADDNPTGTPRDATPVSVTLEDDDTGVSSQTHNVDVVNTPPVIGGAAATAVTRDARTTLTGMFGDRGTDTFTVLVDWGDGTVSTFNNFPAGAFSFDYVYVNGNPNLNNPSAAIPIAVTVIDDDGGVAVFATQAEVLGTGLSVQRIDTSPRVPRLQLPTTTMVADTSARTTTTFTRSTLEEGQLVGDSRTVEEVEVSLRVVTENGEEQEVVKLHLDVLDDLRSFFASLPDGHYRVYITQEGFERLVLDVHLRRGKVVIPEQNDTNGQKAPAEPLHDVPFPATNAEPADGRQSAGEVIPDDVWAEWATARRAVVLLPRPLGEGARHSSRHTPCAVALCAGPSD